MKAQFKKGQIVYLLFSITLIFLVVCSVFTLNNNASIPRWDSKTPLEDSENNNLSNLAPANLSAIVTVKSQIENPAINACVKEFIEQWERIFHRTLPHLTLQSINSTFGLSGAEYLLLNGSLLVGDARFYLNATYPTPASEHETILTPWNNGTIGTGWALYAGSPEALIQALSFHAQAINRVETWSVMERVTPRFPFLLGNYRSFSELITMSDEEVIKDFSETLEKLGGIPGRRCPIIKDYFSMRCFPPAGKPIQT